VLALGGGGEEWAHEGRLTDVLGKAVSGVIRILLVPLEDEILRLQSGTVFLVKL